MKIAMLGHKDFPSRSGGVESVVLELSARLAKRGYDVTAYSRGLHKGKNVYRELGVTVRRIPTFKSQKLNAMVYSFLATFDALFRHFDVIHYHALGPSVPLIIARLFRKRTVATVHGLNWRVDKWKGLASRYIKLGEKIVAKYADAVIVLSEDMRRYFMETYGRETVLINNAVPVLEKLPCREIKERLGLDKDGYILFVGRISPEKGLLELVDGYIASYTDKKLVIAGEVPDNDYGRELRSKCSGRENIILCGFAGGDFLTELYSNCALYILPSHTEGLSLSLLEAMECGARCLVSDIPENTSVLGEFGLSFETGSSSALADGINSSLSSPRTSEQAEKQTAYVRENYDYDRLVDRHEEVYCRVTERRRHKKTEF